MIYAFRITLIYTYSNSINGFSASLTLSELEALKKSPGYLSSTPDQFVQPHTTRSHEFLGLRRGSGAWTASNYGNGVIIGLVDSGIWPESASFKDEGMGKPPPRWKGACVADANFTSSMCNNKIIGARYYNRGFLAKYPDETISMNSSRDSEGHGTHTSSTAAGAFVEGVSYFGYANGTAAGMAPRAWIAVYKAIWSGRIAQSDALAAIDQAIEDGVDILSLSFSFGNNSLNLNPISIACFTAMEKGIFVAASAGNDGNAFGTLSNGEPWVTTVGAEMGTKPAPMVDIYSSRGPFIQCPNVLKPDILAPGTSVLAAWPSNTPVSDNFYHQWYSDFNVLSGTSMATAHVAGVAALVKAVHPNWSPAAIRSALMTTANTLDNTQNPVKEVSNDTVTALDMGAGQVNPNKALDPGLIYNATAEDYVQLLCAMGFTAKEIQKITRSSYECLNPSLDLNYPSFIAYFNDESSAPDELVQVFHRTVTNVGEGQSNYTAELTPLKGLKVKVDPEKLVFNCKHETLSYNLTLEGPKSMTEYLVYGHLSWVSDGGKYVVRSPIVATRMDPGMAPDFFGVRPVRDHNNVNAGKDGFRRHELCCVVTSPAAGEKPWKEFDKIEEEGLLEFDGARRRPSPRCYIIAFVVGFFLLFSLFSLILLCVSKSHKPTITMQSIRFQQFSIQAGVDSSGVPTDMVSVNTIVKFKFRNTATFFGLHVTSTPLHLSFSQLNVATGMMQKFYQPRNSHKTIKVIVRGSNIPLYGGGASLNISNGTVSGAVPLTLSFTVRSRGYVLGRLVRPKFYLRMKCPVAMDFGNPKKKVSIPLKDSCTYRR
ncbi:unnamed protein product, partial [Vitis vinifera]